MECHKLLGGAGAAGTSFVLQLAERNSGLPGCTGSCGACGGSCLVALGVTAVLGLMAWRNQRETKEIEHGQT